MLGELLKRDFVFFDGAIGWILLRKGLKAGQRPDIMNIIAPEAVLEIQRSYYEAGSDILLTNTLGANAVALKDTGYSVEEIIRAGVSIAREAGMGQTLTALDIGQSESSSLRSGRSPLTNPTSCTAVRSSPGRRRAPIWSPLRR